MLSKRLTFLMLGLVLCFTTACAVFNRNTNLSPEGRAGRIGIGIDKVINQAATTAKTLRDNNALTKEQYNDVIQAGITATDFVESDVIPALRALDTVDDANNRNKAIVAINTLIARLAPLYDVGTPDARAKLFADVTQAYVLVRELVREIR